MPWPPSRNTWSPTPWPKLSLKRLEVVDIDQKHAERLALLHRFRLRRTEEFFQRPAVGKPGSECVGARAFLGFRQQFSGSCRVHATFPTKPSLQLAGACRRPGQARSSGFRSATLGIVGAGLCAISDIADRLSSGCGCRKSRRNRKYLRRVHHPMQLLRDVMGDRIVGSRSTRHSSWNRSRLVAASNLRLPAIQDVDGALQLGRSAERIFEPDMEIIRGRRHALFGDRPAWPFRPPRSTYAKSSSSKASAKAGVLDSIGGSASFFFLICRRKVS